jgi:acetyl-CoA C-acetyltransferase
MREAVIVSVARTPIGKAYRGAFNNTDGATLGGHAIAEAVKRAGLEADAIDDVAMGCALQQGTTGGNIARQAALRAGLDQKVSGMTIDRQCSSGLMAIATSAKYIINDGAPIAIGAGIESISLVQNDKVNRFMAGDPWLKQHVPELQCSMIETAEIVADRYGVSREAQDEYALQSQQRTAQAQAEGRFAGEIVPVTTVMKVLVNKETGETADKEITISADEGNRPQTTLADLQKLNPVFKGGRYVKEGRFVTAGNASQHSDGAAAVLLMEGKEAEKRGLEALGAYRGMAVAGCGPEEMGIGPVFAIPKLLERNGLTIDDIDIWELNEAFASQVLYCRDKLGIPNEKLNVSGGSISIGHPYGMTGARLTGHILQEGRRRKAKWGVVTMCIGGGQGGAGLFEIYS